MGDCSHVPVTDDYVDTQIHENKGQTQITVLLPLKAVKRQSASEKIP